MIRIHIWWANLRYAIYEACHQPRDDHDPTIANMVADMRAERVAGVEWIRSHAYVMHGPNRLHWDKCPECAWVTM